MFSEYNRLSGNIGTLANHPALREFSTWGANSSLTGDISVLATIPNIRCWWNDGNSSIYGNIDSLANCTKWTRFNPCSPKISGDISSLRDWSFISELNLQACNITGDISVFADKSKLTKLYVNNTNKPDYPG